MPNPSLVRSTAGFRSLQAFELSSGSVPGLPIGSSVLEAITPFSVSGSTPTSTPDVQVASGVAVSGSVPYYGVMVTGAKVLTINDPTPRSIPHVGEDALQGVQLLPSLEAITGELRLDKTSDVVDSLVGNIRKTTIGEANLLGVGTSQRGFENLLGALAYSAAEDTSITSSTYGSLYWDFRIFPKAYIFNRESGYGQEANERMYVFQPVPVTTHLWGVQFTVPVEGFKTAQMVRGVSQFKPVMCGFLGDGSTKGFPFDSARPAQSTAKIAVFKNGVLQSSGVTKLLYGVSFTTAPASGDIVTVFYEW